MKLISLKYILLLSAACWLGMGCNKKLDQVNPNAQTSESYWQTESDATEGINATYAPLLLDGAYMRFTPILLDVRGDDVRSNSGWTAVSQVGRFTLGTSVGDGYGWAFDEYYEGISRANQVLDKVPGITMNEELKNHILGQAYFLRGLYFFHLVDMFGPVPLPLHSVATSDASYTTPQSTQEEGWAQVESDFKAAIDLLPVSYADAGLSDASDLGRATKGAAMGYLGKAYLFNGMYTEADEQFKAVIDLNIYGLMDNYKDNFTETAENNKESIFEVQFSLTAGGTVLGWQGVPSSTWSKTSARAITYGAPNFGYTDVQPTFSVYNEYLQEKTASGDVDPRLDATIFYNKPGEMIYGQSFSTIYANSTYLNDVFCRKYENGDGDKANEYDWKSGINERLLRYSDILLMYAECENEADNRGVAAKYIQMVRSRVGLPDRTTEFAGYTKDALKEQLGHERLLEFCLEGHRFDDIRRWGWLSNPTKLAWLQARDDEFDSYKTGKELYPIPQVEIDNNPNVKQNSAY